LTANSAVGAGGHDGNGGGACGGELSNCIIYGNTAPNGSNYFTAFLNFCCTTPPPSNGVGNIDAEPLFVDYTGGNLRLQANSPCINAGSNADVIGTTDLDGNPRISGGTVDMGAYEFVFTPSMEVARLIALLNEADRAALQRGKGAESL
jgi:hypothetical protein